MSEQDKQPTVFLCLLVNINALILWMGDVLDDSIFISKRGKEAIKDSLLVCKNQISIQGYCCI